MGANSKTTLLPGDLTPAQLTARFAEMQRAAGYEHGHSYSGDWNMASGFAIHPNQLFASPREAQAYLDQVTDKHGPAIAVRTKTHTTEPVRPVTFGGKPPVIQEGPVLAARIFRSGTVLEWVAADQLPARIQPVVLAAIQAREIARKGANEAKAHLAALLESLYLPETVLKLTELRAVRKAWFVAQKARVKAEAEYAALEETWRPTLYESRTIDTGVKWMIGAVLAE